ncbi:hypothetical protein ACWF94_14090 [Streptomyces sp. NPDC055078]
MRWTPTPGCRRAARPEEHARLLVAQLDGLLYDALARPFLGGEERQRLRHAVGVIVYGYAAPGLRAR